MIKPKTEICWPAFSKIDKTLKKLELNFPKMINQNGISDVKFNANFLFLFLQEN